MTQNVVEVLLFCFFSIPVSHVSSLQPPLAGVHVFACLFDSAPGACVHWSAGPQLCAGLSVFAPAATPRPSAAISILCKLLTASVRSQRAVTRFDVAAPRPAPSDPSCQPSPGEATAESACPEASVACSSLIPFADRRVELPQPHRCGKPARQLGRTRFATLISPQTHTGPL